MHRGGGERSKGEERVKRGWREGGEKGEDEEERRRSRKR
jgi:hypothetical protein